MGEKIRYGVAEIAWGTWGTSSVFETWKYITFRSNTNTIQTLKWSNLNCTKLDLMLFFMHF